VSLRHPYGSPLRPLFPCVRSYARPVTSDPALPAASGPAARSPVGRRVFLGLAGLGALGIAFGARAQAIIGDVAGSGLGGLLPGGDRFRIYSITGTYPAIAPTAYRLKVSAWSSAPPPSRWPTSKQCRARSWRATSSASPDGGFPTCTGKGSGSRICSTRLASAQRRQPSRSSPTTVPIPRASPGPGAPARRAGRLPHARRTGDHRTRRAGAPLRGADVRLQVLKWLSAIRVVDQVEPGFWEQNGYPVNGWADGSTA